MPGMRYFEDCHPGEVTTSAGRTITETDVVNFAGLSGDWYELHTNADYAAKTQFGGRIAHGALIFSISTGLSMRAIPRAGGVIAFYGVDKLRFVKPVFIGDTVHLRQTVREAVPRDEASGLVSTLIEVLNQRAEVVLTYTSKVLYQRRPAADR